MTVPDGVSISGTMALLLLRISEKGWKMRQDYQLTKDEIKKQYGLTKFTAGLSKQEAQDRLQKNGPNVLEVKPTSGWAWPDRKSVV